MTATPTARPAQTMRAGMIVAPGQVDLVHHPVGDPPPGQVRIRLEGCGVCGSNLPVWEGRPWFEYPLAPGAPGHEGWGVVDALGDGIDDPAWLGRRVGVLSHHAFADYDTAAPEHLVALPPNLHGSDVPAEPLGCAMNVFHRSDIRPGHTVAVVGVGFLGALLLQLAIESDARVIAISRRPFALALARDLGAEAAIELGEPSEVARRVADIAGEAGCHRVLEVIGSQHALDVATAITAERGRLIIAGYHQDGPRQVDLQLWNWRGLDVINAHERDPASYVRGMRDGVEAVRTGRLQLAPLITHRFPLDQLDQALRHLHERPDGFLKAVVIA